MLRRESHISRRPMRRPFELLLGVLVAFTVVLTAGNASAAMDLSLSDSARDCCCESEPSATEMDESDDSCCPSSMDEAQDSTQHSQHECPCRIGQDTTPSSAPVGVLAEAPGVSSPDLPTHPSVLLTVSAPRAPGQDVPADFRTESLSSQPPIYLANGTLLI